MSDLLAMQRAVWRSTRPSKEKLVLLAILDHYSDASPKPWPSVGRIGQYTGLGRTAVLDALAGLEGAKVLVVLRANGSANHYDLSGLIEALEAVRQTDQSAKRTGPSRPHQSAKRTGPVRDADRSAAETSPPGGPHQSAWRTPPVRLADPKEPKKEPTKEATAVRAHARPDAELPLVERARLALRDPRAAEQLRPQDWPEAKQIAAAYGAAIGSQRPLSELRRDSGLHAIVELIAAGFAVDDITWVASSVPREPWWRSGERLRGLSSLSVEVASRALGERGAGPRPMLAKARSSPENDEGRRIHRNTLLENAEAGRYGAEFRKAALKRERLRDLVDELERLEALGLLRQNHADSAVPRAATSQRE